MTVTMGEILFHEEKKKGKKQMKASCQKVINLKSLQKQKICSNDHNHWTTQATTEKKLNLPSRTLRLGTGHERFLS